MFLMQRSNKLAAAFGFVFRILRGSAPIGSKRPIEK
jgi:hypothetical protein